MHEITSHPVETPVSGEMVTAGMEEIASAFQSYLADESRLAADSVEKLFFPLNAGDIAAVIREAHADGKTVTISAARTGITGAAVPRSEYVISLEKMTGILELTRNGEAFNVTVEPGISLQELAARVTDKDIDAAVPGASDLSRDESDYFYPVDPTEKTASIGGTCATNASGARTYHYGPTRNFVTGLKVILDNGEALDIPRGKYTFAADGGFSLKDSRGHTRRLQLPSYHLPDVKHAGGYFTAEGMDLVDLFIGSEGTLAIICEVTVKVIPVDTMLFSAIAFFDNEDHAVDFIIRTRESEDIQALALEFFDGNSLDVLRRKKQKEGGGSKIREIPSYARAAVYFEQSYADEDGLYESMDQWDELLTISGSSMDNTWGGMEESEKQMLRDFRHEIPEGVNTIISERKREDDRIHKIGTDMSVPDEHLREIYHYYRDQCGSSDLEYVIFGHIGDNHLHVNILPQTYEDVQKAKELYLDFARKVVEMGGSVAAEHGIGKIKKEFLKVMFGDQGIQEMKNLKQVLDPNAMFSPGNLF
ncbi:FAD-binding oxidoreductase [Planctomycetota bacterium]